MAFKFKYLSQKVFLQFQQSIFNANALWTFFLSLPLHIAENSFEVSSVQIGGIVGADGDQIDWRHQGLVSVLDPLIIFAFINSDTPQHTLHCFLDPSPSNHWTNGANLPPWQHVGCFQILLQFQKESRICQLGVCESRIRTPSLSGKVEIGQGGAIKLIQHGQQLLLAARILFIIG